MSCEKFLMEHVPAIDEGTTIHLYRADVEFGGEMVESIRVKIKAPKGKQKDEDGEKIPF
jgi:hypothetical protein